MSFIHGIDVIMTVKDMKFIQYKSDLLTSEVIDDFRERL